VLLHVPRDHGRLACLYIASGGIRAKLLVSCPHFTYGVPMDALPTTRVPESGNVHHCAVGAAAGARLQWRTPIYVASKVQRPILMLGSSNFGKVGRIAQ